ncbi:MAG: ABC transporter substrate-binding protein [Gemmatimonadota bacterium]|nr:ABC transporter substrate-binding protein [Gemmatimonadota bacterium]
MASETKVPTTRTATGRPRTALLLAALVVACGGGSADRAAPGERPLVLGYAGELQTLNPLISTDQNANELIYALLFTPLVTYDEAFRVRPWLASSWEIDETGVTFDLRDDVVWHDGRPVTAEDVKFTFDTAKNPAVASPLGSVYLANVSTATVESPYRIRFEFAELQAEPLENFFWPPVPRHLLEGVPAEEIAAHPFGRQPVGSGPYTFDSWTVGQGLEFRSREQFPAALGGPAEIGRVSYRIVPEPTTRLGQLRRGEIHVDGPIAPRDADRVSSDPDVDVIAFPWRQFTYIGWNTLRPPFEEPETRRALAMSIDRGELLEAILLGRGRPASSVVPPWHPYDPGLEPLPYDPAAAAALLEAAGWVDADGDGVRERDGVPMSFELVASSRNPVFGDLIQVIQAQLADVGIEVRPRLLEWQTVLGMHRSRDFDAVLTNWVLDNFRVDPRPLFHSSQVAIDGSANRGSYRNPVADSLMDLGARTLDPEAAARIWRDFAGILQRDQPITLLFWNDEIVAVRRELIHTGFDARGELVTLPGWRWRDTGTPE